MAVVAAWRTGSAALLAARPRWFAGREDRGWVRHVGGGGFGLAAKELAFTQTELGAQVFEFVLEFGDPCASALMHTLPVTGLLAEFEVFREQRADVAAWQRGRQRALDRRKGGRKRIRVRRKLHPTSMNSTQLQGEVSRKMRTCLPNSYKFRRQTICLVWV